jgi:hypothetical protein
MRWPAKSDRMAVMGRTESKWSLVSQLAMAASAMALANTKNILTSRSTPAAPPPWPSRRATCWAKVDHCPGANSFCGPLAQ